MEIFSKNMVFYLNCVNCSESASIIKNKVNMMKMMKIFLRAFVFVFLFVFELNLY